MLPVLRNPADRDRHLDLQRWVGVLLEIISKGLTAQNCALLTRKSKFHAPQFSQNFPICTNMPVNVTKRLWMFQYVPNCLKAAVNLENVPNCLKAAVHVSKCSELSQSGCECFTMFLTVSKRLWMFQRAILYYLKVAGNASKCVQGSQSIPRYLKTGQRYPSAWSVSKTSKNRGSEIPSFQTLLYAELLMEILKTRLKIHVYSGKTIQQLSKNNIQRMKRGLN